MLPVEVTLFSSTSIRIGSLESLFEVPSDIAIGPTPLARIGLDMVIDPLHELREQLWHGLLSSTGSGDRSLDRTTRLADCHFTFRGSAGDLDRRTRPTRGRRPFCVLERLGGG